MNWETIFGKKPPVPMKGTEVGAGGGGRGRSGKDKTPVPGLTDEKRKAINKILLQLQQPEGNVAKLTPAEIVLLANTSELALGRAAALMVSENDPRRMERVTQLGELVRKARTDALAVLEARRAAGRAGAAEQPAPANADEPTVVSPEETAGLLAAYEQHQEKYGGEEENGGWEAVSETTSLPNGTPVRVTIGETVIETAVKDRWGGQYVVEVGGMDVALPADYLEARPAAKADRSPAEAEGPAIEEFFVADIATAHESPHVARIEEAPAAGAKAAAKPFRMGELVSAKTQGGETIRGVFYGLGYDKGVSRSVPQALRAMIMLEGGMSVEAVDVADVRHIEENIVERIHEQTGLSPADSVVMKGDRAGTRYRIVEVKTDPHGKRLVELLPESILGGEAARSYAAKIKKASAQIHTPDGRAALDENRKWLDELFVMYKKTVPLDDVEKAV